MPHFDVTSSRLGVRSGTFQNWLICNPICLYNTFHLVFNIFSNHNSFTQTKTNTHDRQTDKMAHNIPNYTALKGVARTIDGIINPSKVLKKNNKFENTDFKPYVGSFICTMVKHVFNEDHWVITPEQSDTFTGKRSD